MKKVLIVDDSAFMRRVISDIIKSDKRFEVVGTAANGQEALDCVNQLLPDVISLDIQMPLMDGLTMLKKLNVDHKIPVVMMSTLTKEGATETIQALELGAFDFVAKPDNIFKVNSAEIREELLEKLYQAAVSGEKSVTKFKPSLSRTYTTEATTSKFIPKPSESVEKKSLTRSDSKVTKLVAIGTSTGGPRALQYLLPYLPKNIDAGIVIVQHMPPGFTKSLSERLDQLSEIRVKEAENGDLIQNGTAYIAPGDRHLLVKQSGNNYVIELSDGPKKGAHKPSVDVMMSSITRINIPHVVGVIMTGMGADGKEGLQDLKNTRKIHIIAQDEESCVVYGMPKSVVEAGIADEIKPLDQLSAAIVKKLEVL
jgi:two-component system, chemotaxis family, protein-glutamate methylesterase/glutaminase